MESPTSPSLPQAPEYIYSIIDGRQVDEAGETLPVINPVDGSVVTNLVEATPEQVEQAVISAKNSFESGSWSSTTCAEKQKVLRKIAVLIRAHAEQLAAMDTTCTGLLYHRSLLPQVFAAADWFDYFASYLEIKRDELFQQLPGIKTLISYEPVGVVGLYSPWNIPVLSASLKLSAALAFSNSCVLKPSEQSPWGTVRLVELIHEAGIPPGVVNLVNGRGVVTGAALCQHNDVAAVSFTGGAQAGKNIASVASSRFAKVTMELGGKGANIIFPDADLESAMDAALASIYSNNGQACLAGSRILVQQDIADAFIQEFVKRSQRIRLGDPFDPVTELGPLSSEVQMQRVLSYVDIVKADNGTVLTGGNPVRDFDKGYYVEPIVALSESNNDRVCQEEIFGPFATFLTFNSVDEAIDIANNTSYGLSAFLWSQDIQKSMTISDHLRTGYICINNTMQRDRNAPFGGFNQSGLDREGGRHSMQFFTEPKTTVLSFEKPLINPLGTS